MGEGEAYDEVVEGLGGLLRTGLDDVLGDGHAVDDGRGVLGFDLVLGADGHQVRGLGVVDGVQVGLLADAAVHGRLLGDDLAKGIASIPAAATRLARAPRGAAASTGGAVGGLLAQQVRGDILVGGVAADLVLLLEGLEVRLGEEEGVLDVLVGVDEVVLARQALVGRDVALEQQAHLLLARGVRVLLGVGGLGPRAQAADLDGRVVVDLVPGGPDVRGHARHEEAVVRGGRAGGGVDGVVELEVVVLEGVVDDGHGGGAVEGVWVGLDGC